MKGFLYTVLTVVFIAGVAIVTCPDKDAHKEKIQSLVNGMVRDYAAEDETLDNSMAEFVTMLTNGISTVALDSMLDVDNYIVCSVGTINYGGESKLVSVGAFNHIFTLSKSQAEKILEEQGF